MSKQEKAVVVFSGGMDSGTLLCDVLAARGTGVYALSFDYGQRHRRELDYAMKFCGDNHIPHMVVDVSGIKEIIGGSSLTSRKKVPHGHYEAESMKDTVVPNRNMIMLSLAIGYAVSIEAQEVYVGVHAGDHAIYPDCRPLFIARMNAVAAISNYESVAIRAPFLAMSKGDIAKRGKVLGVNYGDFYTCYEGKAKACGKCGACQERIEAMKEAGIEDPMVYAK